MTTKTVVTESGKTIKVELVRHVQDKVNFADGYNIVTGREIVEFTNIYFHDESGKVIASGKEIGPLNPKISGQDAKAQAAGRVARVNNVYLTQDVADQITVALAELEAENPKSEEQLAIEQAQADAYARWEADLPAMMEAEAFERKMNRADSDY